MDISGIVGLPAWILCAVVISSKADPGMIVLLEAGSTPLFKSTVSHFVCATDVPSAICACITASFEREASYHVRGAGDDAPCASHELDDLVLEPERDQPPELGPCLREEPGFARLVRPERCGGHVHGLEEPLGRELRIRFVRVL